MSIRHSTPAGMPIARGVLDADGASVHHSPFLASSASNAAMNLTFHLNRPQRPLGHPTRRPVPAAQPTARVLASDEILGRGEVSWLVALGGAVLLAVTLVNLVRNLI